ncbi:type II toxin-antitoxin system VapC family toxin [Candidatus Peregrinibacteria bacterium]|nr:type II toxin-antitoxin system VapC family toxin [Candidatus Peregrinibacteria bacterium]
MKYLLDTNICIYTINKHPQNVFKKFHDICSGEQSDFLAISTLTLSELEYGIHKSLFISKNRISLSKFLNIISILPFDENAAYSYGKIRAYLEEKGKMIGGIDLLIAAHALSQNLILVTNNEKEFCRIPGLKVENWARE